MRKLTAVENAKALMTVAQEWGVWRWLLEKAKVRAAADEAWAALGEAAEKVKAGWSDELRQAYQRLEAADSGSRKRSAGKEHHRIDANIMATAKQLRELDVEAYGARMEAEAIFAEAEKRLSASTAREGARKAIEAWELTEKAIRKAETAARSNKTPSA